MLEESLDVSRDQLLKQQAALAEFGAYALHADSLDDLLTTATACVTRGLGVNRGKILELLPDEDALLIRAGVGWGPDVVGKARLGTGTRSAPGYALEVAEPVISTDLSRETRFEPGEVLRRHAIESMVNVIIPGVEKPFGVLEVDSQSVRDFDRDDINFMLTYANLIGAAIQRFHSTERLRATVREKDVLLRELQHRVKNNLQVIVTLVMLQQRRAQSPEVAKELELISSRIEALRLVHEKLYAAESVSTIALHEYLRELGQNLMGFFGGEAEGIELQLALSEFACGLDEAIPLALITTEFITNSVKHAFRDRAGRISISLDTGPPPQLVLADDGVGRTTSRSIEKGSGMKLIEILAQQVRAEASWDGNPGTRLTLTLPSAMAGDGGRG